MFVADDKDHVTSPLLVQTEREKEVVQQLKQAADTAARQQDELRQAADRETQLQRQLQHETQWSKLLTEFVDFKKYYNAEHGSFYVIHHLPVEVNRVMPAAPLLLRRRTIMLKKNFQFITIFKGEMNHHKPSLHDRLIYLFIYYENRTQSTQ